MDITIQLMYFSFTTLTTVGFGDLHPVSNHERVIILIVLMFGIAAFSLTQTTLSTIQNQILELN